MSTATVHRRRHWLPTLNTLVAVAAIVIAVSRWQPLAVNGRIVPARTDGRVTTYRTPGRPCP